MEYEEKRLMIIELGKQNVPMKEIATKLGYSSVKQISKVLRQEGIEILTPLQAKCVEMRKRGMLYTEIAEAIGIRLSTVRLCCKGLGLEETEEEKKRSIAEGHRKKSVTITKTDDEVAEIIARKIPWFEYAGGYTGCDGFVNIRCKLCGTVCQKSMVSIRHGRKPICKSCEERKRKEKADEIALEKANREKQREAEKDRKESEKEALKDARRTVKVCKQCGERFVTYNKSRVFCSKECAKKYSNTRKDRRISQEKIVDKDITLEALYKRDRGVCYLCGDKCDLDDYVVRAAR